MPPATYRSNPSTGKGEGCRPPSSLSCTTRLRQSVGAGHARPATSPRNLFHGQFVGEGFIPPGHLPLPQTSTAARGLAALRMTREGLLTCRASRTPPPTFIAANSPSPYHPTTKKSCLHQRRQDFFITAYPRITSGQSPQPRRTVPAAPAGSGSPSGR